MSITKNKRRGRNFESKTKKLFENLGHYVIKTSVSDENPDIITFYNGEINLIEVKSIIDPTKTQVIKQLSTQLKKYFDEKERMEKQNFKVNVGCIVWIKCKNKRYKYFIDTNITDINKFLLKLDKFIFQCIYD